ncbi:MAG TPA: class I SAM-dependent methyltransferase [Anaerolineales bacterium]
MTTNLPYHDKPSIWSSHSIIASRLSVLPAQNKVLDVGAASGMLARMCQNKTLRLFGIEPNANWAHIASPLYEKMWICSISDMDEKLLGGFDVIVLGDILEHLPDPEAVLQKLVERQSSGTVFIISVPNIANLWVRLNLLMGRFEYEDRGILDRTHLRFFTRRSLTAMLKNAGLSIISIQATPIPLELVSRFFVTPPGQFLHAILARITSWLPTILGYQFILEARKP